MTSTPGACALADYTYTPTYGQSSSREIRCTRAEQDDLRLPGRPSALPASPGARRRQPVRCHLGRASTLRRHRGREGRGLRRGQGPGRDRQGPQGPVHRALPGRVDATRTTSGVERFRVWRGRTGKYVVHVERSADFTMVDQDGKPAGWRGYLGIGNLSYGIQRRPGEPRGRRVARRASRARPAAALRHGRPRSRASPRSRTSTSDPRPLTGRGGER